MKMTKKLNPLIAALLLATTFNSYSMEPEQPSRGWIAIVGGVLLGAVAIKMLWQPQGDESFSFTALPKELQDQIIQLLSLEITASTLKKAAKTINSLAQVNKELNGLINGPDFCLKLIKHLAAKFNCSDEEAAEALQTKEAKRRSILQMVLYKTFDSRKGFQPGHFEYINDYVNDYVTKHIRDNKNDFDFNFTYNTETPKVFYTILMTSLNRGDTYNRLNAFFYSASNIKKKGEQFGSSFTFNPDKININQRNTQGDTALIICCKKLNYHGFDINLVKLLLIAGADPEIANNSGITPLKLAQQAANQNQNLQPIIDLIQDAIAKKHAQQ